MPSTTPPPLYGHTNVSRPQLQHSLSTHSVTASEDYYSLPSATSSDVSTSTAPRIETPASQYRTPMASRELLTSDRPVSGPMRGDGRRRYSDYRTQSYPNPLRSNPRVRPVIRKPLPNSYYDNAPHVMPDSSTGSRVNRHSDVSTIDDTPYIHFALDQLTRDEEVRGSRVYPEERLTQAETRASADTVRPSEAPVSPLEPPTGATFLSHAHLGDQLGDNTHHIRPPPLALVTSDIDAHPYGSGFDESPVSPLESAETPSSQELPPRNPARASVGPQNARYSSDPEVLLPASPPFGMSHQSLNALPPVLQAVPLAAFIIILIFFLAALIFTAIWSLAKEDLWAYKHFGDNRYFTFEYLPLILAIALLLWLFQLQIALYRVSTSIALASDTHRVRIDIPFLPLQPSGFLFPPFERFSSDQRAIACFLLASWFSLFAIPLLSAAYNVHQFNDGWKWLATQGAIWVVIVLYAILLVCSVWLFVYLWRRQTGLKWDPASLADLFVLLEGSNVLDLYASCFYSSTGPSNREDLVARDVRLGYWKTSTRPNAAIHTLAATGQSVRRYSLFNGQLIEDSTIHRYSHQTTDLESGRPCSYGTMCSLLSKRFSRQPTLTSATSAPYRAFVLRPIIAILLAITFMTLLLAFLIISYLPSTAIQSGFSPDLPIPVNAGGFSAANFLYRIIPSFLGLLLFLLWTHIDMTLRRLQPIANLSKPHGSSAEHSLLLSYTSDGPFLVTIKALINRDYRVAIVSMVALVSAALPVLGGGVFWAEFYVPTQTVRIYGHMPAFHALTAIFTICCVGFLALPMTTSQSDMYSVPSPEGSHRVNSARSLADIIALVHQSKLLVDHAFHAPTTRIQMVTRLLTGLGRGQLNQLPGDDRRLTSKVSLADSIRGFGDARGGKHAGDESRYALGRYTGRDGRTQVGIDRASRMIDGGRTGKGKEKASQ